MLVLGIETSARPGSVALCRNHTPVAERPLDRDGLRHAQALPVEVEAILADCGLNARDIQLIAISHGPGSFTGLRVGMAFAKTLAWSLDCPMVAVDTFAAVATDLDDLQPITAGTAWIISDAQRQQWFARRYRKTDDGDWTPTTDHAIVSPETLANPGMPVLDGTSRNLPRAATIARLGRVMLDAGHSADLRTATPLYLRPSAAEEAAGRIAD